MDVAEDVVELVKDSKRMLGLELFDCVDDDVTDVEDDDGDHDNQEQGMG
jgi:hypothetical protein